MMSDAKSVAAYMKELPDEIRKTLAGLRSLIRKVAPHAKESMKYGMPCYTLNRDFVAFASQKHYMALYICDAALIEPFKKKLGKVNCGKGCIRFKKADDLNMKVVEELLTLSAEKARTKDTPVEKKK